VAVGGKGVWAVETCSLRVAAKVGQWTATWVRPRFLSEPPMMALVCLCPRYTMFEYFAQEEVEVSNADSPCCSEGADGCLAIGER